MFGGGEDLLIGGTTTFDSNVHALAAIQREWTSGHSYEQRLANLRGDNGSASFGRRLNGEVFLRVAGANATVFDDLAANSLIGQGGRDWYFAVTSGPNADLVVFTGDERIERLRKG